MDITRLRPYKFHSLAQIFDLQILHFQWYLTRFHFTESDYKSKQLRVKNFLTQSGSYQTAAQWSILCLLWAIFFRISPSTFDGFIRANYYAIGIENYELFVISPILGFMTAEKFWLDSFRHVLGGKRGVYDLLYEFKNDTKELQSNFSERQKLLQTFQMVTLYSGLCFKLIAGYLVIHAASLCTFSLLSWTTGHTQDFWAMALHLYMSMGICVYAGIAIAIPSMLSPHIYLLLVILKRHLNKCYHILMYGHRLLPNSALFIDKFKQNYVHLHRQLRLLNQSLSGQLRLHDATFKAAGIITVIFYFQHSKRMGAFGVFDVSSWLLVYAILNWILLKIADFPAQSKICYNRLLSISSRKQMAKSIRATNNRQPCHEQLKLDDLVDFLSNNLFGLTFGSLYLLTRMQIFSGLKKNVFLITLFYQKLAI